MKTKKRIFISSVQKEFKKERRALKDYIHGDPLLSRYFDVFLFEDMPAKDKKADVAYLAEVDCCDIYLGLFGNEYGYEDLKGISPTEAEFDRATKKKKIRLIFVKGTTNQARHKKIKKLISKAGEELIRRRFAATPDLCVAVYASLVEALTDTGVLRTKPFDASACIDAKISDISREKLATFLEQAQTGRGYPLGPKTPVVKALTHLNLLDKGKPSHAAILLFGKQPQKFLITSEVKCLHFHGTEVRKPIPSYQIYKGTVFELVDQAVDFVMSKIDRSVGTRSESARAPVTYELPQQAVAEAIVNAVAHRDYASNASVQVMLFSDRLEIWNPGELHPPLTLKTITKPHPSIPPNPLIAEPLFLAKYIEKAGSGILDMLKLCKEAGLKKPEFRQDAGIFAQVLWRPKQKTTRQTTADFKKDKEERPMSPTQSPTQSTDPVVRLVLALKDGAQSASELRNALKIKHRHTFRTNYLRPTLEKGLIEQTLPDKPNSRLQKYRLTVKGKNILKKK